MDTRRIELSKDEDYVIIHREGEQQGECIDVSYDSHIIRLYQEASWKIHPMNRNSRTTEIQVLDRS